MEGRRGRAVKTTPLGEAKAHLRAVNRTLAAHYTMCFRCAHAGADLGRYCDDGWALLKLQTRAQAQIREVGAPARPRALQGELW